MREIMGIATARAMDAPKGVIAKASASNRNVLRIVWDQADDYPEHAWGYVQWSVRPFRQQDGCDGTIDDNVHLIAYRFCQQLKLDYATLMDKAYAWQKDGHSGDWVRQMSPRDWSAIEVETIVPALSDETLRKLLYDLSDINNSSLTQVLEDKFTALGYDVERWWEDR